MSEEKLYAVKNAKGIYLSYSDDKHYRWREGEVAATISQRIAHDLCTEHGGHVVTLVEEPKKVTVSPNEAQAIESLLNANTYADLYDSFKYLFTSRYKKDIKRLTEAIKNGYTVKKNQYRVLAPKSWWESENEPEYMHMNVLNGIENYKGADDDTLFTQKQLDLYGLNGAPFTKEEVTDDDD